MSGLFSWLEELWIETWQTNEKTMMFERVILPIVTNAIFDRIRNKINLRTIFTEGRHSESIHDINESIRVLESWLSEFDNTRETIRFSSSVKRKWDFQNIR